ncbi:MAG: MarR family winged helix-turn-helix transcriptional regulator [Solirubrobacteraceae bacterium]
MSEFAADWVGVLANAVDAKAAEAVGGIGGSEVGALSTCLSFGEVGVGELGEVLGLTGSGAVRLVDRLEHDGLILRQARQGRSVSVRLSARGRRRAEQLRQRRLAAIEQLLGSLSAGERDQLTGLLDKLLHNAGLDAGTARTVCRFCDHRRCDRDICPVGRSLRARKEPSVRAASGVSS